MQEYSDSLLFLVVGVAFLCGYSVVSFLMKRVKELQDRPSLNDQIWSEQAKTEEERQRKNEDHRGHAGES